jgi:hypothetical protein
MPVGSMLPEVLNVETVPLGVGYGVRLGIVPLDGGVVVVGFTVPLPEQPNGAQARMLEAAQAASRMTNVRCLSFIKRPSLRTGTVE